VRGAVDYDRVAPFLSFPLSVDSSFCFSPDYHSSFRGRFFIRAVFPFHRKRHPPILDRGLEAASSGSLGIPTPAKSVSSLDSLIPFPSPPFLLLARRKQQVVARASAGGLPAPLPSFPPPPLSSSSIPLLFRYSSTMPLVPPVPIELLAVGSSSPFRFIKALFLYSDSSPSFPRIRGPFFKITSQPF